MYILLKLEYAALLALSVQIFLQTGYDWWVFLMLFLAPDIGMLGYVINTKIGALTYNTFHHIGTAVAFLIAGTGIAIPWLTLIGAVLLGHSAFDRLFGYGLKYSDSFKHTHIKDL